MADSKNGIFGEDRNGLTIREILSKYIAKWPIFLISLIVCIGAGIYYFRYTAPKYEASTSLMVISNFAKVSDVIEDALKGKQEINLTNEILYLSSESLMARNVLKNNFNIYYFRKGKLLNIDIYNSAPFILEPQKITDDNFSFSFNIKTLDSSGGDFTYGPDNSLKLFSFKWDSPFRINGQTFVLEAKRKTFANEPEYIVQWKPVGLVTSELLKYLTVKALDPKSNVIELSLITENLQKGVDVLNGLFEEFNLSDIEDRTNLSKSTVQFIDNRLLNISGELKGVEGNLEDYQGSQDLVDIKGQSTQSMENSNTLSKTIKDINVQKGIVSMISDYFSNSDNNGKLVPSSLGLNDATLSLLITQYNELQLKKQRETPVVAPNSTVMQDLNTQLDNLKRSILESLNSIGKNLDFQANNFEQQNSQYKNFLSTIPHNERILQEIKRKQGVTEGLYLYLLQKREEAAISSTASNVAHYKQLDPASGEGPVEPKLSNILLYTTLLGFAIGFGFIYFRDILNDRVDNLYDIRKRTSIPILGEIRHIPKRKKQAISVLGKSMAGEEFRVLRTNISFILKKKGDKTILVTSSMSGEGKSFISFNLAAVCAMPGKKVALLEFDTRNPSFGDRLTVNGEIGLTDFITGNKKILGEIYQTVAEIPSLHIYPCGPLPTNSADLLLMKSVTDLFEILKAEYDYIIINTPPAGLVSDAFILGKFADLSLFIIRQRFTLKKQVHFANDLSASKKLNDINLVFNDLISNEKYTYYGYGYEQKEKSKKHHKS
jgi:capsular exopolysaccharide synthesis family protein